MMMIPEMRMRAEHLHIPHIPIISLDRAPGAARMCGGQPDAAAR
jgi:hypothetical protein